MRILLLFILVLVSITGFNQNTELTEIRVNPEVRVVSDINSDSLPNGRYKVIYRNKTLVKGTTNNGKMTGVWISYYTNGLQKLKGRFVNGKKHGEWTLWAKDGAMLAKFQYNHGIKIGHWQGYYSTHKKAIDLVYQPSGNLLQCIQYYPNEVIALNFEYDYDSQIVKSELSYYYENFNLFQYEQHTGNEIDGTYARYHSNGVIWEQFTYDKGNLLQVDEMRSKGGMPRKNENFRDGNGILKRYYFNGNTFSNTAYSGGKKNGEFEILDFGGDFSGSGHFKNNIPVKKWDVYSKYHNRFMFVDFDTVSNLVFISKKTSPAQKEHTEGTVLDGYLHGEWRSYDAYGDIISVLNYKNGYKHGIQTYYQSDKIIRTFSYLNGNRSGKFTYFNTFGEVLSEDIYESETTMDSNWYQSPIKDWISVTNKSPHNNNVKINFYPPLPALDFYKSYISYYDKQEFMFPVQRSLSYDYWPELVPASFVGGRLAEQDYLIKYLKIPDDIKKKRVEGSVLLRYKVNEFGLISDITLLKTIGLGLDEVAISLIKSFPPMNPATFNGIPIESYIVREIDFRF